MQVGVNLYDRPLDRRFTPAELKELKAGEVKVVSRIGDRVEAVVRLDPSVPIYFYGARAVNPAAIAQINEARSAASQYSAAAQAHPRSAAPVQRDPAAGRRC